MRRVQHGRFYFALEKAGFERLTLEALFQGFKNHEDSGAEEDFLVSGLYGVSRSYIKPLAPKIA